MRIFLLGADGFIGRHIATHLRACGYEVIACARRTRALERMGFEVFKADLTHGADWNQALQDCSAIVNAAGLLSGSEVAMQRVHAETPAKIYRAGKLAGVHKIILISAVGIDADTPFARHRMAGEAVARESGLPTVILRPSLVLGETSYGGSSLLRALSALPFFMPVIGDGSQEFDPIHVDDLAASVRRAIEFNTLDGQTISVCGPERVTQEQMMHAFQSWLGRPTTRDLPLPLWFARKLGWLGDRLKLGPVSTAAVVQLEHGVTADYQTFHKTTGQTPRGFSEILAERPAGSQDLWHARLYLLRPTIRFALMFMWLISGLVGFFLPADRFMAGLSSVPLSDAALTFAARLAGLIDLAIALGLLLAWHLPKLATIQFAMVGVYTLAFGMLTPALWAEPYGGLLKNIPILCLILAHKILEEER